MTLEFTIQQMSEQTGLSGHTLRYYEKIGLILDVARASSSHRRYTESDLEWINFLKQLKAPGMPLEEMRRFAELRLQGPMSAAQRRVMLETHRRKIMAQVDELNRCLDLIDMKVERHRRTEAELGHLNQKT